MTGNLVSKNVSSIRASVFPSPLHKTIVKSHGSHAARHAPFPIIWNPHSLSTQFVCSSALVLCHRHPPSACTHSQRKRKCPSVACFCNFGQNRRRRQKHANSMYVCDAELSVDAARRQRASVCAGRAWRDFHLPVRIPRRLFWSSAWAFSRLKKHEGVGRKTHIIHWRDGGEEERVKKNAGWWSAWVSAFAQNVFSCCGDRTGNVPYPTLEEQVWDVKVESV